MARNDLPEPERLMDLGSGMGLWKIHVDLLVERDVNARMMAPEKMARLQQNIADAGGLESFPLVYRKEHAGQTLFDIVSGHHRTRAARAAGLMVIPCIVIERTLSDDEITAKQLAHNALAGHDDLDVLRRLYDSIEDPLARLASGLTDMEIADTSIPSIPGAAVGFEFGFEPVYILFMAAGLQRFEAMLDRLEPDARLYAADHADWDRFVEVVKKTSRARNVRNIGAIMTAMLDLAEIGLAVEKQRNAS